MQKTAENERRFRQFFHVFMRSANVGKYFSTNSGVLVRKLFPLRYSSAPAGVSKTNRSRHEQSACPYSP